MGPPSYLEKLFGSDTDSDCVIRFAVSAESPTFRCLKKARIENGSSGSAEASPSSGPPTKDSQGISSPHTLRERVVRSGGPAGDDDDVNCVPGVTYIGEPLPAHRVLLRSSSEFFRVYMERWEQRTNPAPTPPVNRSKDPLPTTAIEENVRSACTDSPSPTVPPDHQQEGQKPLTKGEGKPSSGGSGTQAASANSDKPADEGGPASPAAAARTGGSGDHGDGGRPPTEARSPPGAPVKGKRAHGSLPSSDSAGGGGQPEIVVSLGSEEELPSARRALQFIYTGRVSSSLGFKDILQTRRMGEYLQIEGCAQACDTALRDKLRVECMTDTAAVLDAYACWRAFPEATDGSFDNFMRLCQTCLVRHFSDALSILNSDPDRPGSLHHQFLRLPPPAIEALLASEHFGTDSESSVLLLLGMWLQYYPVHPPGLRRRLCRLVRVLHLSRAYLTFVLPRLNWFDATPQQCSALAALAATSSAAERSGFIASCDAVGLKFVLDAHSLPPELEPYSPVSRMEVSGRAWICPDPRRHVTMPQHAKSYTWEVRWSAIEHIARRVAGSTEASRWWERNAGFRAVQTRGSTASAARGATEGEAEALLPSIFGHGLEWKVSLGMSTDQAPYATLCCEVPQLLTRSVPGTHDLGRWPVHLAIRRLAGPDWVLRTGTLASFGSRMRTEVLARAAREQFMEGLDRVGGGGGGVAAAAAAVGTREAALLEPLRQYLQPNGVVRGELIFRRRDQQPQQPLPPPMPHQQRLGALGLPPEHGEEDGEDDEHEFDEDDGLSDEDLDMPLEEIWEM